MKKLILCCAGVLLLTACATGQKDPGRVGQMYFTTIAFDVNGDEIATASYKQIDEAVKVYMRNPPYRWKCAGIPIPAATPKAICACRKNARTAWPSPANPRDRQK